MLYFGSADPVVMAGGPHPIPSRTRSLSPLALMVLRLKAWESKSLPGPPIRNLRSLTRPLDPSPHDGRGRSRRGQIQWRWSRSIRSRFRVEVTEFAAGWSSPVARQAHNLKVAGSNPAPAPKSPPSPLGDRGFLCLRRLRARKRVRAVSRLALPRQAAGGDDGSPCLRR